MPIPEQAPPEKKSARTKKDLSKEIAAVLTQPPLDRAHWGVDVVDLDSGKALYSQNSDQLFLPASNAKLFTTAAALAIAGPDYRFRTTVEAEGKIDDNGRLLGDLAIVGRGDPNISGRALPYALKTQRTPPHTQILEEMADQVARSGLKIVDGDLIGDDTYYAFERYAEGWAVDDLQWIDGAPVSALSFNDNVVFVNILPGEQPGDKALITVEPETGYYEAGQSHGDHRRRSYEQDRHPSRSGLEEDCALGIAAAGRCGNERAAGDRRSGGVCGPACFARCWSGAASPFAARRERAMERARSSLIRFSTADCRTPGIDNPADCHQRRRVAAAAEQLRRVLSAANAHQQTAIALRRRPSLEIKFWRNTSPHRCWTISA